MTLSTKAAIALLSSEKAQKGICWFLAVVLSPIILISVLLCAIGTGTAEHNTLSVQASFYGSAFSEKVPTEYSEHVKDMQKSFSLLDSAIASVNANAEGNGLDPLQVKSIFYALCFGEDVPSRCAANQFTKCFYTVETRADENGDSCTVNVPLTMGQAYVNLSAELGREITSEDKANADHIYQLIAGEAAGGTYAGLFIPGGDRCLDIDITAFKNPNTKNGYDLAQYAISAWRSGWGYVWGTYGSVLTENLLQSKCGQYPTQVGAHRSYIAKTWLGGRCTDCVGLIKSYGWFDAVSMNIVYGSNGMPDIGANQMYYNAKVSGSIDTIPEIPGLAVWKDGHIGVYIGNGEVIEAMGTHYGVVKTKLEGRGWTNWLEVPYINY